ncbi:MAG: hypothetical protein DRJ38_08080 [Thermoprotei archaeon]|nr:MAG: hypothetical protein DRJ38_08080 [Thermoprotei archaeon]
MKKGVLISGDNSSLGVRNELIIVDSENILSITIPGSEVTLPPVNVIANGDFSNDYESWTYSPEKNWPLLFNEIYGAAVYWRQINKDGRLSQTFTVRDDYFLKEAVLKFRWRVLTGCFGRVTVTIDDIEVYDGSGFSGDDVEISIDTSILTPGSHTITFNVYTGRQFCTLLIDDVKLFLTYTYMEGGVNNVILYGIMIEVDFDLTNPRIYNYTCRLSAKANQSLILEVYVFDENSNVWTLDNKLLAEKDKWFGLALNVPKVRLYAESQTPFKLEFDYLYVETVELNPTGFTLFLKNTGSSTLEVIACWLKNETMSAVRYEVDRIILPGEEIGIDIPIVLSRGSTYEVRVITKNNVFKFQFTP